MQSEHRIMIANSCLNSNFAHTLGRELQSFQAAVQAVAVGATENSTHRFRFLFCFSSFPSLQVPTKAETGVHNVNVLSFISDWIKQCVLFNVNVQVLQCFDTTCALWLTSFAFNSFFPGRFEGIPRPVAHHTNFCSTKVWLQNSIRRLEKSLWQVLLWAVLYLFSWLVFPFTDFPYNV